MLINVPEGYYTVTQAARALKISNSNMNYHIQQKNIEIVEFNQGTKNYYRLISQKALDAFRKMRDPDPDGEHLYEIICITCGQVSVLFSTRDIRALRIQYTHMIEFEHKFIRIRLDGEVLPIFESDRIGYTTHSNLNKEVAANGKKMERGKGAAAGDLSRHDKGGVLHGKESGVLRSGADAPGKRDNGRHRASQGEQKEPLQNVVKGDQGDVRISQEKAGREVLPGVSVRSRGGRPRKYATQEERRIAEAERVRRWRHEHCEQSREASKRYYDANREKISERRKAWREKHREQYNAWAAEYRRAHREEYKAYCREYYRRKKEAMK